MTPTRDRFGSCCATRRTVKWFGSWTPSIPPVCICRIPTSVRPTRPESRVPQRMGTWRPPGATPMRREWNIWAEPEDPTWKSPEFSRKKGRFSGKKREKRVRSTCWSSTSTWAKSVFTVKSRLRLWVIPNLASPPTSQGYSTPGPDWGMRWAALSTYGVTVMTLWGGGATSSRTPAYSSR
jgi:hypothetical protein